MRSKNFAVFVFCCSLTTALAVQLPPTSSAGFLVASDPLAFGIPTVTIFVDGPNGGTIDWDNAGVDDPWPDGACGFRIDAVNMPGSDNDPQDEGGWAWYGGYIDVQGNPLQILIDGVDLNGLDLEDEPGNYLEFTGPYGGDCEDGYVFHTPATPDSLPPPGAIALVIQFYDWDDIEFLDGGFQPYSVPDNPWPPDPDPDPIDFCEIAPWMCDATQDFLSCDYIETFDGPVNNCPNGEDEAEVIGGLGFVAGWGLGEIADFVARQPSRAASVLSALNATSQRLRTAEHHHAALLRETGMVKASRDQAVQRSRLAVSLGLARRQLGTCDSQVRALAKSGRASRTQTLQAVARCREAAGSFSSVHRAATAYRQFLSAGSRR